jgi:hypothetical protein
MPRGEAAEISAGGYVVWSLCEPQIQDGHEIKHDGNRRARGGEIAICDGTGLAVFNPPLYSEVSDRLMCRRRP